MLRAALMGLTFTWQVQPERLRAYASDSTHSTEKTARLGEVLIWRKNSHHVPSWHLGQLVLLMRRIDRY